MGGRGCDLLLKQGPQTRQAKVGKKVAGESVMAVGKARSGTRCRCSDSQRHWAYLPRCDWLGSRRPCRSRGLQAGSFRPSWRPQLEKMRHGRTGLAGP